MRRRELLNTAASVGGAALSTVLGGLSRVRATAKPLHPRGELHAGRVVRYGLPAPTGVAWLDEPGAEDALVRTSRAIGLPAPLPDVRGLSLRLRRDDGMGWADLLFATTGTGRVGRYLLKPTWTQRASYGSLLPYRTPSGPVLLAAFPEGTLREDRWRLAVASPTGAWNAFGTLELDPEGETAGDAETPVRFDPVLHTLPGLDPYEWVARLRESSYASARRHSP